MAMMMSITTVLTVISTVLLILLIYVYSRNLKRAKSGFTIGLFIFALLFLIQNIVSVYFYLTMMDYYASGVEVHAFILTLLQTIGFAILLKITWD